MTHEPFETLAPVYAVGALDGDDLGRFEAHLREGCAECADAIRASSEALAALGHAATPTMPPPHVRDALLRRVDASSRPRRTRFGWVRWAVATTAAAAAAAVITGGSVASRYEKWIGVM